VTSVLDALHIPDGWERHPFGRIVERTKRSDRPDLQPLSVFLDEGVVPRSSREDNFNRLGEDMSKYLVVKPGDVVFNKLRTWQGGFGMSRFEGVVSPAYFVCRPRPVVEPRFLHYLLRSVPYLAELTRVSKFMPPSQFDILWDDLRLLRVALPPIGGQRAIADYLDAETTRIDALVEKKRRMVELLDERRQAAIDSALVGVGRPVRVRHVVSRLTSGPRGWAEHVADDGTLFLRIANVEANDIELNMKSVVRVEAPDGAERRRTAVRAGDVLISITAEIGSVGVARVEHEGAAISQHVALMTPSGCSGEWLALSLSTSAAKAQLDASRYGGTKTQLGLDDVRDTFIDVVDQYDELKMVTALGERIMQLKVGGSMLNQQIALLEEHRQAIITAAVTGDLDIPGFAA
jgi:type I restriction enzyme S subunit